MTDTMHDAALRDAAREVLRWADRQGCAHETTHRGGTHWIICDMCGVKWDEAESPPDHVEPGAFGRLRAALAAPTAQSDAEPVYQWQRLDGAWEDCTAEAHDGATLSKTPRRGPLYAAPRAASDARDAARYRALREDFARRTPGRTPEDYDRGADAIAERAATAEGNRFDGEAGAAQADAEPVYLVGIAGVWSEVTERAYADAKAPLAKRILYAAPGPAGGDARDAGRTVRHKKRGTTYSVIGEAGLQTEQPLVDGDHLVVYRGTADDLWARPPHEFEDGRFEDIAAIAKQDGGVE